MIGVIRFRSDLLREIAFRGIPRQKYTASTHIDTLNPAWLLNTVMMPALLNMIRVKIAYRIIEVPLPILSFVGRIVCAPPHANLPMGAPRMRANWNIANPKRIVQVVIAAISIMH
jgi:hypothetical protein